jgi:rhamnogalacturonyl hydrolase YesR
MLGCSDTRNDAALRAVAGGGAGGVPAGTAGTQSGTGTNPQAGESSGGQINGVAGGAGTTSLGASGAGGNGGGAGAGGMGLPYPPRTDVIEVLDRVNRQFAEKWPDPAMILPGSRPSNIWTRAVYYEGLLALHAVAPRADYRDFAIDWAEHHDWGLRAPTNNADNQCAGQAYIELYELDGAMDSQRIAAIQASIDALVNGNTSASWTWIDAIQMSMPIFAQLSELSGDPKYLQRMRDFYVHTRDEEGGGLYDRVKHLWWRDAKWKPEQQLTPNGKAVYWSRGNGWVFAALVRVLQRLPESDPHRAAYLQDFRDMAAALLLRQREDGLWNPSLDDPEHYGGPELTGTALFVYGMAWGAQRFARGADLRARHHRSVAGHADGVGSCHWFLGLRPIDRRGSERRAAFDLRQAAGFRRLRGWLLPSRRQRARTTRLPRRALTKRGARGDQRKLQCGSDCDALIK